MSESRSSNNFRCPKCGAAAGSDVKDSRGCETWIRRRRSCNACGHRFTTRETVWDENVEAPEILKPESVSRLRALIIEMLKITGQSQSSEELSNR